MRFDSIVGNPPYQKSNQNTKDDALYHHFYNLAGAKGSKYCLVSPARFLFRAGATPSEWNDEMLSDGHVTVVLYEQDTKKVFPSTEFKGGVAIVLRDESKNFGKIGEFRSSKEMASLLRKVERLNEKTLDTIVSGQGVYLYTQRMHDENPEVCKVLSNGHKFDIVTKALDHLDNVLFFPTKPDDEYEYIKILGKYQREKGKRKVRAYHWIRRDYVNEPAGHNSYRVLIANANASGKKLGERLSSPLIGQPGTGFTQTFLAIGPFVNEVEAGNALKYIKSKFARMMLSALKKTQHTTSRKWKKVPLQDFTENGSIDWTKPIADIDQQLYRKYGLNEDDIRFIENTAQSMG